VCDSPLSTHTDDEENDDYDEHGNLRYLYSVPPEDRVGLNDGMDGSYWLLSGESRPRRSRKIHTFDSLLFVLNVQVVCLSMCSYGHDHIKQQARRKPVVLTPEQEAARRGKYMKNPNKTNLFIGF